MEILVWAAIIVLFWMGIYNLRLISEIAGELRTHQYKHIYKRATETIDDKPAEQVRIKKAVIFNPNIDPMGEFNGKRDDWFGESNE
jgi:hypothetical protein